MLRPGWLRVKQRSAVLLLPAPWRFAYDAAPEQWSVPWPATPVLATPVLAAQAHDGKTLMRPGNPAALAADAVLAANQAFYDTFNARDADAMALLWSREHAVACIHPGWPPLTGREAVLDAWRGILGNPNTPTITCDRAEAMLWGDVALVLCFEQLGGTVLAASNLFRLEDGVWRMVHHQAGPAAEGPQENDPPARPRGRLH